MTKKTTLKLACICLIGISMIWLACQKENHFAASGEVSFNVLSNIHPDLKCTSDCDLNHADKVIITVQHADGTPTDYTQHELDVYTMGGAFITKKIALPFGNYKVTEFYIIDALDNVIFACPLEGSEMAQNVDAPLPVLFSVNEKNSSAVDIEVVCAINLEPEDFGLVQFPIIEVETFQFLISISELGTDQLLTADLTVISGAYSYQQALDPIVDNIVTLRGGFTDYVLLVEKNGYHSHTETFTKSELLGFKTTPLIVELEKITVEDKDGNVYQTVPIGDQLWMAENLKTTKFNNSADIPLVTDNTAWDNLTTPGYCWYNNDVANKETYGALYNWYAVNTGEICPTGWHVPTATEWTTLADYLGGEIVAGGKLKETGITHWKSPNRGATNETGFTALPGGSRFNIVSFWNIGKAGCWWSATEFNTYNAWNRAMSYTIRDLGKGTSPKENGYAVRCLRD